MSYASHSLGYQELIGGTDLYREKETEVAEERVVSSSDHMIGGHLRVSKMALMASSGHRRLYSTGIRATGS